MRGFYWSGRPFSPASGAAMTMGDMGWPVALVALALLGVAAVSRRLSGTPVTPAMVFVAFGLLVGTEGARRDRRLEHERDGPHAGRGDAGAGAVLRRLADRPRATCAASVGVPLRLLGIGLPLTIALGSAVAVVAVRPAQRRGGGHPRRSSLAPTDAALGQAVVTDPRVPERIRQGLNVESGLNDGICVPLLFAAVAAADVQSEIAEGRSAGTLLLEEIGYGVLGGAAAGALIAVIVVEAGRRDLIAGRVAAGDPGRGRGARVRDRERRSAARASSPRSSRAWRSGWRSARPGGAQPAHRGGRRRAQRRHVRALRRHPARPGARAT